MPYKKGDVLKSDEYRMKVLEILGDLYFCSETWDESKYAERKSNGGGHYRTQFELNGGGWSLCPPDQTLLPAEPWKPEGGEHYYYGYIDSTEDVYSSHTTFSGDNKTDQRRLAIGNVHKTSEEAIAFARKRWNVE